MAFQPGAVTINPDGTIASKTGMAGKIYDAFIAAFETDLGYPLPSPIESVDALTGMANNATHTAFGICQEVINSPLEAGSVLTRNSAAAQTVNVGYQQLIKFTEDGESLGGITLDWANSRITVGDTGIYLVAWNASFKGTAGVQFTTAVAVNGTENERVASRAEIQVAGATASMGTVGLLSLTSSDILTVRIKASAAGSSFTGVFMNLTVQQLSQATI